MDLAAELAALEADARLRLAAAGFPPDLTRAPTPAEVLSRTDFAGIEDDVDKATALLVLAGRRARDDAVETILRRIAAEARTTAEVLVALDRLVLGRLPDELRDVADELQEAVRPVLGKLERDAGDRLLVDARRGRLTIVGQPRRTGVVPAVQASRLGADTVSAAITATRGAAYRTSRAQSAAAFVRAVREQALATGTKGLDDVAAQAALGASGAGRVGALEALDEDGTTYYASELLDRSTCTPCGSVDGREYASRAAALEDYPDGRYRDCEGGDRCRGTLVAVSADEVAPSLPAEDREDVRSRVTA